MDLNDLPPEFLNCTIRLDGFLASLPPDDRHETAIQLVSKAFDSMNRNTLTAYRDAFRTDPTFWTFLQPDTREELADLAEGQLLALDMDSPAGAE